MGYSTNIDYYDMLWDIGHSRLLREMAAAAFCAVVKAKGE